MMRYLARVSVLCLGLLALPLPAMAQPVQDAIVSQLQSQGFTDMEISRTLLGRTRIAARRGSTYREIVFNVATGEILRDYWEDRDRSGTRSVPRLINPGGARSGGEGDGRDRDDDGGDDDAVDDRDERDDASGRGRGRGRGGDDNDDNEIEDRSDDDSGRGRGRGGDDDEDKDEDED